ncbi:MAG: acetyl-CoA carboxylase, carboxyltransferase subunit beta, partial [Lachnospiraceae bacterium]|nr:acetyl-CoA carboxylase, carboxyltransferase subunit beta [Lachnospiraceae bacterium]
MQNQCTCKCCGRTWDLSDLRRKRFICPECGYYFRIPARERIRTVCDRGTFEEWFGEMTTTNRLNHEGYDEKLEKAKEATGLNEAVITGKGEMFGSPFALAVCDSNFLMGSMGYVVGEKITRMIERATDEKLPVFVFCCSGGARMQEGLISLMQMEKTAAAVARHGQAGLLYCTILTDPTMGGVTASFAMLGDVIAAEPGAEIGFAGKRVIRQTIGEELPHGFQTAEFMEKHGMIDGIVERRVMKKVLFFMLHSHSDRYKTTGAENIREIISKSGANPPLFKSETKSKWEKVRSIRSSDFVPTMTYISKIFDIFIELKGDRKYRDDRSVVGGIALIDGRPVTVITEYRGYDIKEAVERNFGMPMPEGYRKSYRLMKQAEKFNRPIITFINTPGAYCGVGAEERGQGEAIAQNLLLMSTLKVPVLAIIVGEAGSGGALALAVGNEVWMFENAIYSILTPEGFASILWKDASRAEEAAEKMHISAGDLIKL